MYPILSFQSFYVIHCYCRHIDMITHFYLPFSLISSYIYEIYVFHCGSGSKWSVVRRHKVIVLWSWNPSHAPLSIPWFCITPIGTYNEFGYVICSVGFEVCKPRAVTYYEIFGASVLYDVPRDISHCVVCRGSIFVIQAVIAISHLLLLTFSPCAVSSKIFLFTSCTIVVWIFYFFSITFASLMKKGCHVGR